MKKSFLALPVALFLTACGVSVMGMVPLEGPATVALEGENALVVFVRHTRVGNRISFPVVMEDGQFVANLRGSMHAAVPVAPGGHRFFVLAENAELVDIDAAPGRVYVVETRVRMGWVKARVTVEGVLRNTERFSEAVEWVRDTRPFVADPTAGTAWAASHRGSILSKVESALEAYREGDDAYREARTLHVEDGYLPNEADF